MFILPFWIITLLFFINILFGRKIGYQGAGALSVSFMFLSCIFSVINLIEVVFFSSFGAFNVLMWFDVGLVQEGFLFIFDALSNIMISVVILISTFVHIYSVEYLRLDPHFVRFIAYLNLFTLFMLILVNSGNFLLMFIGWEGIGLVSYLLIGFWTTRNYANQSSVKAILVNRIGDFGFFFSLVVLFNVFKTLDFSILSLLSPFLCGLNFKIIISGNNFDILEFITFTLFIGALSKSSQIGGHVWLYSAMEPTPVSSLIHAATLVTAGIYLLLRTSFLLDLCELNLTFITAMGCFTTLLAGTAGAVQNDIKSIIAFSTCSQLGFIFIACGLSQFNLAFFHLINHAFLYAVELGTKRFVCQVLSEKMGVYYFSTISKAVLFLCAGSLIHSILNDQDLRNYGGLAKFFPISLTIMFFASLSLTGFPGLSGFYSKDLLFEAIWTSSLFNSCIVDQSFTIWVIVITTFFTAFYSFRLLILAFLSDPRFSRKNIIQLYESKLEIQVGIISLFLLSLTTGFYFKDIFIGVGSNVFNGDLFYYCTDVYAIESEFINLNIKLLPLLLTICGVGLSLALARVNLLYHWKIYRSMISLTNNKWYWDILLYKIVSLKLSTALWFLIRFLDKGFFEQTGPVLGFILFNKFGYKSLMQHFGQTMFYLYASSH
nr:Nad5 [Porphyridium purpureum]UBY46113.1 Nad5 [Porphyridium purpureum]